MIKRNRIRLFSVGLASFLFFLWAVPVHATLDGNKLFKETYPGKDANYYKCSICHTGKIGKKGAENLNPYGKSLGLVLPKKLTVEMLKEAEALDPDEDGVSSEKEIEAGTLPGDATSVP